VPLILGLRLDCEMAALSSLAMTGLKASFLCSVCVGMACGLGMSWSWCGCSTRRRESEKRVASSGVQKYMSIVCSLYMYLPWFIGSGVGRCHCDMSWWGLGAALPLGLRKPSTVRVNRHGCLYVWLALTVSSSAWAAVSSQGMYDVLQEGLTTSKGVLLRCASMVRYLYAPGLPDRIVVEVDIGAFVEAVMWGLLGRRGEVVVDVCEAVVALAACSSGVRGHAQCQ
jgi:hypothetical protein